MKTRLAVTVWSALLVLAVTSACKSADSGSSAQSSASPGQPSSTTTCGQGLVPVDLSLPVPPDIKLNVYNGTDQPDLARHVANDFKARQFIVDPEKAGNDPRGKRVDGVGMLRYGPKAVGAAWVVRSYLLNSATLDFDITRTDDVVDVVLGSGFKQLGTLTEVDQALTQAGPVKLPPGTCDAPTGSGHGP